MHTVYSFKLLSLLPLFVYLGDGKSSVHADTFLPLCVSQRYTPSQQGVAFNSGAKQRVIRMVEMQKDPMEPPRFK